MKEDHACDGDEANKAVDKIKSHHFFSSCLCLNSFFIVYGICAANIKRKNELSKRCSHLRLLFMSKNVQTERKAKLAWVFCREGRKFRCRKNSCSLPEELEFVAQRTRIRCPSERKTLPMVLKNDGQRLKKLSAMFSETMGNTFYSYESCYFNVSALLTVDWPHRQ